MGVSNNMGTPGCHIDNHQIWIISPPHPPQIFGKLPKKSQMGMLQIADVPGRSGVASS